MATRDENKNGDEVTFGQELDDFAKQFELKDSEKESEEKPEAQQFSSVCVQGPCIHYIETRMPVGKNHVSGMPLFVRKQCRCGVDFAKGTETKEGISLIFDQNYTLPVSCNQWMPMLDEELHALEERRQFAEEKIKSKRILENIADLDTEPSSNSVIQLDESISDLPEDLSDL